MKCGVVSQCGLTIARSRNLVFVVTVIRFPMAKAMGYINVGAKALYFAATGL
jgi:hypothetical protein